MAGSAITGSGFLAGSPSAYSGANSQLTPAVQELWSKEILFMAMPTLRFEQFAVKKTELGVQPGLTIHFMRYNNLPAAAQLVEGVRMEPVALTASQFDISVAEQGFAVAVTELLLNASFDDVMASAARLLGRNMALYLDGSARDTLRQATSMLFGYNKPALASAVRTPLSPYDHGVPATGATGTSASTYTGLAVGNYAMTAAVTKDVAETLATKNVPRLGDSYVGFVHPHQSRQLRDDPEWIEVTKYAAPGNFMLGEIGRINDIVFIETTQVWNDLVSNAYSGVTGGNTALYYDAIFIGDNAFGHAISLPVELRDAGILDYGREHGLAWYSIWGLGLITDQACVIARTN
jgi:N4-gp56 family major capsid protein